MFPSKPTEYLDLEQLLTSKPHTHTHMSVGPEGPLLARHREKSAAALRSPECPDKCLHIWAAKVHLWFECKAQPPNSAKTYKDDWESPKIWEPDE